LPHFWGGWVGFLGYEAGRLFETLPPPKPGPRSWPDLWFMQVDRLLVYDHFTQTLKIIAAPEKSGTGKDYPRLAEEIRQRWDRIKCVLESCRVSPVAADLLPSPPLSPGFSNGGNGYRANLTRRDYLDRVRRVKAFIQEGDIYQANLAQRFETEFDGHPLDLYLELRRVNPSPFSAFLQADGGTVVSSSPERLVRVDGGAIETRPIAGTRPRGHSPESDRLLSAELLLNEKERAEHLMLVDLERNDLGRICRTGSVRVTDLMFLEQYSHVSHIVSNIAG
ncbi:MAG: aminodeoxychorismate synthase component I, partial [Nitrospinaceae bacterium]|nr:anthranilate synthase component I family protein [Nitrospinaceae bacterium]NIR57595.1 anthranilate synthase component I family protein [Nitrospinaceae bacterium]NIS88065.1 anthranilate synthase component I family protein [Nitrospinaceae bacterium]NIT84929.1 anthranilate synthase component I family protein [Nitrospinaceae bacterium]NIU47105.1 anthranilate synthase component I family protein [Nitrospinaceae bacterium]